ncbi:MAG: phage upper tail fiber protein [Candidatus Saccharimonadaceae bacterium]
MSYSPGAGYTDENARDAIGGAIQVSTGLTKTINDTNNTISITLNNPVMVLTQAAYDAIVTKDSATLYVIVG